MIIKQLSVFLENKCGRLSEVSKILGDSNINMTALSIADTSDFGILRVIVSDPDRAITLLKHNNFSSSLTDVVCVICPNQPGALSRILDILESSDIQIEYLYAFSTDVSANIVIRPTNVQKCIDILQQHEVDLMKQSDLYKL